MTKPLQSLPPGRPKGATSLDKGVALRFGQAVREMRTNAGIAQESLAHMAGLERSYLGRLERGQSQPTLAVILKLSNALGCSAGELVDRVASAPELK